MLITTTGRYGSHSPISTLALILLAATIPTAYAVELSTEDLFKLSLEELTQINVTVASLFDNKELDAPSTVSVVTENDWRRQGARRTLDAIGHLPETMVLPVNAGLDVIAIRGYAQTTSARGIATTLDGIPLNNFSLGTGQYETPNIGLGVLDRIEMIRGPGSALYGSAAFHGVLALHAFESDHDVKRITSELGENGYYQGALKYSTAVSAPLRLNLAMAASGQPDQERMYSYTDQATQQQASARKEHRYHSQTASVKLVSDPQQDFSYRWGLYADRYQSDGFPLNSARSDTEQDSTTTLTQLALTKKLAAGRSVELSGYYRQGEFERIFQFPFGGGLFRGDTLGDEHHVGATVTLRQPASDNRRTQWAVAVSQEVEGVDKRSTDVRLPDGTATHTRHDAEGADRTIRSALLEANTRFWHDRWQVIYGGRVDHYPDFGTHTSPRLGLVFQPQPDTAIKVLYGNAFRAPTAVERYPDTANIVGSPDIQPETLDSYELIVMKQVPTWKAEIVLFKNRWQDGITLTPDPGGSGPGTYENTGSNEAEGLALNLTWLPKPWRADFSGSYTKSENLATDQNYALFPRTILNLGFGYTLSEFDTEIYMSNRLFFNAEEVPQTPTNNPEQLPTYWRADLNINKKLTHDLHLFFNVKNLFDRNNRLPSVLGVENGIPDQPLSASAGMRYEF